MDSLGLRFAKLPRGILEYICDYAKKHGCKVIQIFWILPTGKTTSIEPNNDEGCNLNIVVRCPSSTRMIVIEREVYRLYGLMAHYEKCYKKEVTKK